MHKDRIPLTWLYVPASRPDRIPKALASTADIVIVDLEDAVAPAVKDEARANLAILNDFPEADVEVRINGAETPWFEEDIEAVRALTRPVGVRIPKAEDPEVIRQLAAELNGCELTLLIESAIGVERAFELATCHPSVVAIGLGEADLKSQIGMSTEQGLAWIRSRIVVAAAAAGLRAPAMSVYANVKDSEGLAASCAEGKALGMVGRAAIHPCQLDVIVESFVPEAREVQRATEILDAMERASDAGNGTYVLSDGTFLDVAMVDAAKRIVLLSR